MNALTPHPMRSWTSIAVVLLCGALTVTHGDGSALSTASWDLTFEQRVAAQEAIEEVYWRHRIWPSENLAPKPPLANLLPDEAMRAKVDDYLRKSNALATLWDRPITAEQLQAELDRMSRQTRDAGMLRELFAALGNQPFLIAETLARQTLADRLMRTWYARDERFHGDVEREAERALRAGSGRVADMRSLGGDYVERTFVGRESDEIVFAEPREDGAIELGPEAWAKMMADLGRRFRTSPEAIPLRKVSVLREESDRFSVTAVLSRQDHAVTVAVVTWSKDPFDSWWSVARDASSPEPASVPNSYAIVEPLDGACADDTWSTRYYGPEARSLHTAVWTGTEVIVWGGYDGDELQSGGRYNPSTDSWAPTLTGPGVPATRCAHTAVWTGTEMIVWGGSSQCYSGGDLNTGGRYNPTTDSWVPTTKRCIEVP